MLGITKVAMRVTPEFVTQENGACAQALPEGVLDGLIALGLEFDLKLIILFGSRARGLFRSNSDYDIAIVEKHFLPPSVKESIEFKISSMLSGTDTVFTQDNGPLLLANIVREALVIYEAQPHDFSFFELSCWRKYNEYLPYLELRRALLRASLS